MKTNPTPLFFFFLLLALTAFAQDSLVVTEPISRIKGQQVSNVTFTDTVHYEAAPVLLYGDTLFLIKTPLNKSSTAERAEKITKNIKKIARDFNIGMDTIYLRNGVDFVNIMYNDELVFLVTSKDAVAFKIPKEDLAKVQMDRLREKLITKNTNLTLKEMFIRAGYFIISLIGLIIILKLINWIFGKLIVSLSKFEKSVLNRKNNLIKYFIPKSTKNIFVFLAKATRFVLIVFFLLAYLPFMFSFFPLTKGLVDLFYGYIETPVLFLIYGFINFLPNLFFIMVIVIFTRYILKVSRYFVEDIENGKLVLKNFPKDWAQTTQKMFSLLIYAFALVLIYPQIPGSTSSAFKGVSIFIGALLSFGSTSAIANMVAGVVITYMQPFKIGDRIKVQGIYGDVIEKTILITRLQTPKMEEVTIPNANIISSQIINYSANSNKNGVIMHTSITLGYDVPWSLAEKLLLRAARKSVLLQRDPKPFVLQTSLDDNYVSHELNVYTKQEKKMPLIYSNIHKNILDVFNEAGVEILSPQYIAARDGNMTTVPNLITKDMRTPIDKIVDHLTGKNQKPTVTKTSTDKNKE
jgi:small-conductance mechanosensitive channel